MLNIAVLVSGGGTNLQTLINAQKAGKIPDGKITLVVASRDDAYALTRAERAGIPVKVLRRRDFAEQDEYDAELLRILEQEKIGLVVLAGFMTIISPRVIDRYRNRIINIHPSLIPSFCGEGCYGLRVHQAVLKKGVKVTGATVHFVNEICDGGPIILQKAVEVLPDDTPETLQRRVMEQAEWKLLPKAVALFCAGLLEVENGVVKVRGNLDLQRMSLEDHLGENPYPGRGILLGRSEDGNNAVVAYFIMGRSENSRNRVFEAEGQGLRTRAFDESKLSDPSLIIYSPVRVLENGTTVVTNGDQTDTVCEYLEAGKSFEEALLTRTFEPDAPNFTPRISGIVETENGFRFTLSILKSGETPEITVREFYRYDSPEAGEGRLIHTYSGDGDPLPSFLGEPVRVAVEGSIDQLAHRIWNSLNEDNKISLFVRFISLRTGLMETRILNKNR